MDAMVRFLQQGGNSMHPFQVRSSRDENISKIVLIETDHPRPYERYLRYVYRLHVVERCS